MREKDYEFRKIVEECNGVGLEVANRLGLSPQAVSARLNSEKHLHWWTQFKRNKNRATVVTAADEVAAANSSTETIVEEVEPTESCRKLRALVVRHRGELRVVAALLGTNEKLIESLLTGPENREWWKACRFNKKSAYSKNVVAEFTLPVEDSTEENELLLKIAQLEKERDAYKEALSMYEAAHQLASNVQAKHL